MSIRELVAIAEQQAGVFSVRQALHLGVPRSTIDDLAERMGMHRPARGVLVLPGADPSGERTSLWTALCSVGAPAWIGGRSSLSLDEVVRRPSVIDLVVPPDRRPRPREGVRVHRLPITPDQVHRGDRLPRLATHAALRQVAARDGHRETLAAVASAVQSGAVTLDEVEAAAIPRTAGAALLRTVVVQLAGTGAHSVLAHEVTVLLRTAGFVLDAEQVVVRRPDGSIVRTDLRIRATRVVIEVDGHAFHGTREQLAHDRARANDMAAEGLTVLRVDWHRLHTDAPGFLAQVHRAVATDTRERQRTA